MCCAVEYTGPVVVLMIYWDFNSMFTSIIITLQHYGKEDGEVDDYLLEMD